jgi:membrane dipeptidase
MRRSRWLLCCLCALLSTSACLSQDARDAAPAPPADSSTASAAAPAVPEPPAVFTDGGPVAMPAIRQRVLVREDSLWAEALRIHYNALVMDGHIDTPSLMLDDGYRLGARHRMHEAHVDLPRMFEGGLDAAFFSIYVGGYYGEGQRATDRARTMIAELKRQVATHADSVAMAYSAADVRSITQAGKKAILMGLEGGHALAGSPDVLAELYEAGIRYVTLTHVNTNSWADASQSAPRWDGLNDVGRQLVREMNRLGVLVDLSHTSDATFYDALEVSEAPPILSHSSCRALTGNVRNADDAMLRALAEKGGVVMINYYAPMVNTHLTPDVWDEVQRRLDASGQSLRSLWKVAFDVQRERGLPGASLEDVLDHIDHAVQVAGVDHVALGSDFDGAYMPRGLEDVTRLPWITYGLLKRGFSVADLYKILGGNTLRVLEAAAQNAHPQPEAP